jgi:hypothetical protein
MQKMWLPVMGRMWCSRRAGAGKCSEIETMPVQRKEPRKRLKAHHAKEGIGHRRSNSRKEALVPSLTDLTGNGNSWKSTQM